MASKAEEMAEAYSGEQWDPSGNDFLLFRNIFLAGMRALLAEAEAWGRLPVDDLTFDGATNEQIGLASELLDHLRALFEQKEEGKDDEGK